MVQKACVSAVTDIGRGRHPTSCATVDMGDCQKLVCFEDRISEVQFCLETTLITLRTLIDIYTLSVVGTPGTGVWKTSRSPQTDDILCALKEKERQVARDRKEADFVLSKIQRTKSTVSHFL